MFFPAASFVQMKCPTILKLFAFHVVLAASFTESFSQDWFWKNPLPQGNDLHALCSAGAGVLYAVGDFGTVIKSTNGGSNWFLLETSTTIDLYGVWFISPDWGMVVGDEGTFLQTTDGGVTWTQRTIASGATLYGVSFPDPLIGNVVGYPGTVLKTTNGGSTWQQQLAGGGDHLHAVHFTDANKGIIVGSQGVIFRTTNGGRAWGRQVDSTSRNLYSVSFPDSMNGFAVGEIGLILHTSDGGKVWKPQQSGTAYLLKSVSFSDSNNGTIVGESNAILTTTNGGATWVPQSSGIVASFTAVLQIDAMTTIAVGYSGIAIKTTYAGASWNKKSVGSIVPLHDASLFDAARGIAVGLAGTVHTTSNRGTSWISQPSGVTSNLEAVTSFGTDTALAVGENGSLIRTENGGLTWTDLSFPIVGGKTYWYSGVAFSLSGNAIIVGKVDSLVPGSPPATLQFSVVLRSSDGGKTWTRSRILVAPVPGANPQLFRPWLLSVAFVDSNTVVAVGDGGTVIRSTDSGQSWELVTSGTTEVLNSVAFSKTRIGVGTAVGEGEGTVLHTNDGGLTWGRVQLIGQTLRAICYGDTTFAMAVGDNGRMFHTSNGGRNWSTVSLLGTNKLMVLRTQKGLYGVSLAGGNIIMVGDGGIILGSEGPDIPVVVESSEPGNIPTSVALRQNYPNPFNPETTIEFQIERSGPVHLAVYDLLGRQVATLVDERKPPGVYRVRWSASLFPSGMYIIRLHQDGLILSRKMLFVR